MVIFGGGGWGIFPTISQLFSRKTCLRMRLVMVLAGAGASALRCSCSSPTPTPESTWDSAHLDPLARCLQHLTEQEAPGEQPGVEGRKQAGACGRCSDPACACPVPELRRKGALGPEQREERQRPDFCFRVHLTPVLLAVVSSNVWTPTGFLPCAPSASAPAAGCQGETGK